MNNNIYRYKRDGRTGCSTVPPAFLHGSRLLDVESEIAHAGHEGHGKDNGRKEVLADYGEDHAGYASDKEDVVQGIGIEGSPVEQQIGRHKGCHDCCRYVVEPGLHEGRKLS